MASCLLVAIFFYSGCSTKFSWKKLQDGYYEIIANNNRFSPSCEKIDEERYGFSVQILDEKNTVMTALGRITNFRQCNEWKNKVIRVLNSSLQIKIAGTGDIEMERSLDYSVKYEFKNLGTFYSNQRVIQGDKIYNKDNCFAFYDRNCE